MTARVRSENYRSVERVLPIFELLEQTTNIGAKEEALRILAEISAEPECRAAIRQTGGFGLLVEFLKGGAEHVTLVGRAVRVVRNLANDSAAARKALRQAGATENLIPLIAHDEESPVAVDAIAAVGYLAHHDQQTKAVVRRMGGVPLLVRMLHAEAAKPITCYAAAALHNLIDGSARNKNALRAAGAIPRLVQLMDCDSENPVVEVAVRTLHKLAEKFDDAQADIRRTGGLGKLVELQTKTTSVSLRNWIEKTLQTLRLTEKEVDDSKVLLTLGSSFQKEFDKLKHGSDQILLGVREMHEALKASVADSQEQNTCLAAENDQLRSAVEERDAQLDELQGLLEEKSIEFEALQGNLREKEILIEELEANVNEKQDAVRSGEDRLQEKEVQMSRLKESLHEKSLETKKLTTMLEEKSRHIDHLENLIVEKERQINASLGQERDGAERAKQERNATILELVQTLRDVVSTTRPGSPAASKQEEVHKISDSIQSLIQQPLARSPMEQPKPVTALSARPSVGAGFSQEAEEKLTVAPRDALSRRTSFVPSRLRKHQSLRRGTSLATSTADPLAKTQSLPIHSIARQSSVQRPI